MAQRDEDKGDGSMISSIELASSLDSFTNNENATVTPALIALLRHIAATGSHVGYPWAGVRKLISVHLDTVLSELIARSSRPADLDGESYDVRLARMQTLLKAWPRAPFTLQRICELLTDHRRFYRTAAKYMLAFSKLVCGISARAEIEEDTELQAPPPAFFGFGGASSMDISDDKSTDSSLLAPATAMPTSAFPRDTMDLLTHPPTSVTPVSFAPVSIVAAPSVGTSPFDAAAAAASSASASANVVVSVNDDPAPAVNVAITSIPSTPSPPTTDSIASAAFPFPSTESSSTTASETAAGVSVAAEDTPVAATASTPVTTDADKAMDVTE